MVAGRIRHGDARVACTPLACGVTVVSGLAVMFEVPSGSTFRTDQSIKLPLAESHDSVELAPPELP